MVVVEGVPGVPSVVAAVRAAEEFSLSPLNSWCGSHGSRGTCTCTPVAMVSDILAADGYSC